MKVVEEFRASLAALIKDCATKEEKLRSLREYARQNILGVWHYPDDREPCCECAKADLAVCHLPQVGIRGYLGTGPFSIVSDTPSDDVHFVRRQASLYYAKLKAYGLENAFLTDVFNTANANRECSEQQALFIVQLEVVRPQVMLIMDMSSRRRKKRGGWHPYPGPMQTLEQHLRVDGFVLEVNAEFELRAATVKCDPSVGAGFSFDVYRIYHYAKLTDYRGGKENPEADWEAQFRNAIMMAQLTTKVAELKTELEKLPTDRQEQLKRDLEAEADSGKAEA